MLIIDRTCSHQFRGTYYISIFHSLPLYYLPTDGLHIFYKYFTWLPKCKQYILYVYIVCASLIREFTSYIVSNLLYPIEQFLGNTVEKPGNRQQQKTLNVPK